MAKVRLPDGQVVTVEGLSFGVPEAEHGISDPVADRVIGELYEEKWRMEGPNALDRAVDSSEDLPRDFRYYWTAEFHQVANHLAAEYLVARIPGAEIVSPKPPVPDWDAMDLSVPEGARS